MLSFASSILSYGNAELDATRTVFADPGSALRDDKSGCFRAARASPILR